MKKTATGEALLIIAAIVASFALVGVASAASFTLSAAPSATLVGGTIVPLQGRLLLLLPGLGLLGLGARRAGRQRNPGLR